MNLKVGDIIEYEQDSRINSAWWGTQAIVTFVADKWQYSSVKIIKTNDPKTVPLNADIDIGCFKIRVVSTKKSPHPDWL